MNSCQKLKEEIFHQVPFDIALPRYACKYTAFRRSIGRPKTIGRALAFSHLLLRHRKNIYRNDLIAGSIAGMADCCNHSKDYTAEKDFVNRIGERWFHSNYDHAAPDYSKLVTLGVKGILEEVRCSRDNIEASDPESRSKMDFLESVELSLRAFGKFIRQYSFAADNHLKCEKNPDARLRLEMISENCRNIAANPPHSFYEALQLVWFAHLAFVLEGRYAMALGRLDQYLRPFYEEDRKNGRITRDEALDLITCTFLKIGESKSLLGYDDVVNICIGGVDSKGNDATNELSFIILEAVKNAAIPGPNLSARIHRNTQDEFYLKCLEVIKTGIGYPALFNDEIIIPSLTDKGYPLDVARDYCLVGCIETFIPGKQPPWSDGRFDTPKYIELALNNGICMIKGEQRGLPTGDPCSFPTFDEFMEAYKKQLEYAAGRYVNGFNKNNVLPYPDEFTSPFMSALFDDCIGRAKDINDGGTIYPSNHGAACMGIGTVADSLCAIKELVYDRKLISMNMLVNAVKADFKGYETVQQQLKAAAPKYGNDVDGVDEFAVNFVEYLSELFNSYRTHDGGHFFMLIAANVNNISAGKTIYATPDGRNAFQPLSDAGSPTYGMDKNGPTAVVNSVTKPNYRLVTGGTVINQKFHPSCFKDETTMRKVMSLLKVYFKKGGQQIQLNVIDRNTLNDAIEHPGKYESLVVRVSGFSAYFNSLPMEVKKDILSRSEQVI